MLMSSENIDGIARFMEFQIYLKSFFKKRIANKKKKKKKKKEKEEKKKKTIKRSLESSTIKDSSFLCQHEEE